VRFDSDYDADAPELAEYYQRLMEQAEELLLTRTTAEWLQLFEAAGVPAGPVGFIETMLDDEQAHANDMIIEQDHSVVGKVRTVGPLTRMSETPPQARLSSPALGQHTDEVLAELGYSPEEIVRLRRDGAVG
jgi:crotonobetainyl-CoA:carnitine CoA-transferase CaiB-like acyl-CoA transferase